MTGDDDDVDSDGDSRVLVRKWKKVEPRGYVFPYNGGVVGSNQADI